MSTSLLGCSFSCCLRESSGHTVLVHMAACTQQQMVMAAESDSLLALELYDMQDCSNAPDMLATSCVQVSSRKRQYLLGTVERLQIIKSFQKSCFCPLQQDEPRCCDTAKCGIGAGFRFISVRMSCMLSSCQAGEITHLLGQ